MRTFAASLLKCLALAGVMHGVCATARADDLAWKMEGYAPREAASTCASAAWSDFRAYEVALGVSSAWPGLERREYSSLLSLARWIRPNGAMCIIIK